MRRRLSLTAALVLLLSLLCACAAQHAQEMDENGYELYFSAIPTPRAAATPSARRKSV